MTPRPIPVGERFWSKVLVAGPDDCWEWVGGTREGYGYFDVAGRRGSAHRWSYESAVGPIPPGLVVCHRCDNRRCVNPAHLFAGTQADNVRDMYAKGREARECRDGTQVARMLRAKAARPDRWARGERVGSAKLTAVQVVGIRSLLAEGHSHSSIARRFGVGHTLIGQIAAGRLWRHVA